ncbi:unnamed protein product, partial [Discosporangium mesarthrocarpum]
VEPCSGAPERPVASASTCILRIGHAYLLNTFNAQGLADLLNSTESWTEATAGTKEWHEKGFRLIWDSTKRRFVILNVLKAAFVLRWADSPLATELLGFGGYDHRACPAPEPLLDPHQPGDPPRKHMAVVADMPPPPFLRPQWRNVVWGPPAMEVARGGELKIQVWARDSSPEGRLWRPRRWRMGAGRPGLAGGQGDASDGSWLVGSASLDGKEACQLATGRVLELPLLKAPPGRLQRAPREGGGNQYGAIARRLSRASSFTLGLGQVLGQLQGDVERQRQGQEDAAVEV